MISLAWLVRINTFTTLVTSFVLEVGMHVYMCLPPGYYVNEA